MWNNLGYLSEDTISHLNEYFEEQKPNLNLTHYGRVKKVRILKLSSVDKAEILEALLECYDLINKKTLTPYISYILEYYEDSYTKIHVDSIGDDDGDSLTTVTLIDKSDDLQGGNMLLRDEANAITVLNPDLGEMISYDHRTWHGVSKVLKGTRRVLVNWYNVKG